MKSIKSLQHQMLSNESPFIIKLVLDPNQVGVQFFSLSHSLTLSPSVRCPSLPSRLSVRVSGGDALGSRAGGGLGCLARDLATMSFESPCDIGDKTSSPFSSNRTMFETEEVSRATALQRPTDVRVLPDGCNGAVEPLFSSTTPPCYVSKMGN